MFRSPNLDTIQICLYFSHIPDTDTSSDANLGDKTIYLSSETTGLNLNKIWDQLQRNSMSKIVCLHFQLHSRKGTRLPDADFGSSTTHPGEHQYQIWHNQVQALWHMWCLRRAWRARMGQRPKFKPEHRRAVLSLVCCAFLQKAYERPLVLYVLTKSWPTSSEIPIYSSPYNCHASISRSVNHEIRLQGKRTYHSSTHPQMLSGRFRTVRRVKNQ